MKIVLFEPQIPQNTGNIIRTCSITGSDLILVKPLGFKVDNKSLKRAGLDYIDEVSITLIDDLADFLQKQPGNFYFFSSHGKKNYSEVSYGANDILIFGSESHGLPDYYHKKYSDQFYTIPMKANRRSLNLANSTAIVLYEGLRQLKFEGLN